MKPSCPEASTIVRYEGESLSAWISIPKYPDTNLAPLVAVHGIKRGAYEQAVVFSRVVAESGRIVIAPLFDADRWPRYQLAVRGGRADRALNELVSGITAAYGLRSELFHLFGFSGGAQFAHRYAMLHSSRLRSLNVCAAGWYTFPDETRFPRGFGGDGWGKRLAEAQTAFLQLPISVTVGELDQRRDRSLRRSAELDAQQGRTRRDRAARWRASLLRAGEQRGLEVDASFSLIPGCAHRFMDCAVSGLCEHIASAIAHAEMKELARCA